MTGPDRPPMNLRMRRAAGVLLALLMLPCGQLLAIDFEYVAKRAQDLSERPYVAPPDTALPRELIELEPRQYRDIRFKPERAIWAQRGLPFELQLIHPGQHYRKPVRIHLLTADGVAPVAFRAEDFDYGKRNGQLDPGRYGDIGFAGFRVRHLGKGAQDGREVMSFLGASYFRALGAGQQYGLSARGLAVDTGLLSGEEFPYFTEFWIAWPRAEDRHLTVYGLLDSRRMAGAYRFVLRPGITTTVEVTSRVYLREGVTKLGLAPLTSMFHFGENQRSVSEDYRPEVHKSDGLMVHTGNDEWVWRPLINPRRLIVTSFATRNPKGYGLMQRDRDWNNYQDLNQRYDLRPSAWVEPRGAWGPGRVELVSIPTPDEFNDNIVAYWVPETPPPVGPGLDYNYRLSWQMEEEIRPPGGWVVQSRRSRGWVSQADESLRMVVDFDGPRLRELPPDAKLLGAIWLNENGALMEREVIRNEVNGQWRLSFRFHRLNAAEPVEIRAFLKNDEDVLTETWSYLLAP